MSDDLLFTPVVELRDLLARRELAPTELMQALLERVERVNPELNAIVALRGEEALVEAREPRDGPLAGIPVTIKDLNETADLPTTFGSRAFARHRTGYDAEIVARLRRAGAIVVGKTNTPEFGLRATTENRLYGTSRNPWNLEHNPGGSSGGAAAALAAGISPLAQGSDGGGSIRNPASCCNVVGLKPTRGRVPGAPASYETWAGLATDGPLARTVRDTALMLDVIAGPVVGEPYGLPEPVATFLAACERPPARLRIAWTVEPPYGAVDPEVADAVRAAARVLESLGHDVVEGGPDLGGLREDFVTIVASNAATLARVVPPARLGELEPTTLTAILRGQRLRAPDYCAAVDHARTRSAEIMSWWERNDVLVTPVMTKLPPRLGAMPSSHDFETIWAEISELGAFTNPFNISGLPALAVPAGWSRDGLPIGVQLVGRYGGDAELLALAAAYEEAAPWADRRPPARA